MLNTHALTMLAVKGLQCVVCRSWLAHETHARAHARHSHTLADHSQESVCGPLMTMCPRLQRPSSSRCLRKQRLRRADCVSSTTLAAMLFIILIQGVHLSNITAKFSFFPPWTALLLQMRLQPNRRKRSYHGQSSVGLMRAKGSGPDNS